MEFNKLKLQLVENEENQEVILKNIELDCTIKLENSETSDLKEFFDAIFKYIIDREVLLEFELESFIDKTLFQNVAGDLINQINDEIKASEVQFEEIIAFKNLI